MVQVECDDANEDRDGDENYCEEEVFANEWYDEARRRHQIDHEQEEERKCDENTNSESYFVSFRVCRYVEDECCKYSDQHARYDKVDSEE